MNDQQLEDLMRELKRLDNRLKAHGGVLLGMILVVMVMAVVLVILWKGWHL